MQDVTSRYPSRLTNTVPSDEGLVSLTGDMKCEVRQDSTTVGRCSHKRNLRRSLDLEGALNLSIFPQSYAIISAKHLFGGLNFETPKLFSRLG